MLMEGTPFVQGTVDGLFILNHPPKRTLDPPPCRKTLSSPTDRWLKAPWEGGGAGVLGGAMGGGGDLGGALGGGSGRVRWRGGVGSPYLRLPSL